MDTKNFINEIKERVQLALVISIFFPPLLATFLGVTGVSEDKLGEHVLSLSGLVGIFLLIYVILGASKDLVIPISRLKWLNRLLLVNIACFIFPILLFATSYGSKEIPRFMFWTQLTLYAISLWGLVILGTASLTILLVGIGDGLLEKLGKWKEDRNSKK